MTSRLDQSFCWAKNAKKFHYSIGYAYYSIGNLNYINFQTNPIKYMYEEKHRGDKSSNDTQRGNDLFCLLPPSPPPHYVRLTIYVG